MKDMYTRYFIFSRETLNQRKDINAKTGRSYEPGVVIVNGVPKIYTDILVDLNKAQVDAVVLTSGDIRRISYTKEIIRKI